MHASAEGAFVVPSQKLGEGSRGATMPVARGPAIGVAVVQWSCGTGAGRRKPARAPAMAPGRGAGSWRQVVLVLA